MKSKKLIYLIVLVMSIFIIGCNNVKNNVSPSNNETGNKTDENLTDNIIYKNTQYGFNFTLPKSWENYSIITDKWEGIALSSTESGKAVEKGSIINIRHSQWTKENPRQDIPIMVFTLDQWDSLKNEEFSVGAAPIPPSELGRNSKYVFALPARYNYAFLTGFEEVENILKGNALTPNEDFQ